MIKQRYDLYLNTLELGITQAADVVIVEDAATLQQVGFRYTPDYLANSAAFAIDPAQLPLREGETLFDCRGGAPAFLDDYLPDAWGRKVLTQLALYRDKQRFNANSVIDTLTMMGSSRIGAISLVRRGEAPQFDRGHDLATLDRAEQAAQHIDILDFETIELEEMGLLYLANAGTGVGGARPKALLYDIAGSYLAKFNRLSYDSYNNARVELACLLMAQAAGLEMGNGHIKEGINGREVLLLDRFDIEETGRNHLVTVNGLLKHPQTQQDPGSTFRYDDILALLRIHSVSIERDLKHLLRLMLFNRAINNTDDHERNFSLIHRGHGYQLAPAYDLVPSLATGAYHAAGFGLKPYPPRPSEASRMGKLLGLPHTEVSQIAEQVRRAILCWRDHAEQAGVDEEDVQKVGKILKP